MSLVNERARIVSNDQIGPRLHVLTVESPQIASAIMPGQFVHMKVPGRNENILRRPFSVYARDSEAGMLEVLYQEVGELTSYMPTLSDGIIETIGPIGNTWSGPARVHDGACGNALLVGGGVGAAPLFLLAESLKQLGCPFDVVLGAQTRDALVTLRRYSDLIGCEPCCATDDGSYGRSGFCMSLVEERLDQGGIAQPGPYDYVAVCGPEPLMKIVAGMAHAAQVACEVSMEKRMACGIGACLSCVVDTKSGKKRSCVDGPIFDAGEVMW
ncbi:MAG: dihydroorotate dehydrogenase electron transfer subunit [Eggerthellaceae bacterium]|nr:dihydroorotate dehydrogenase electron transfer subunit [Eggerthellaceae bacterium]